MADPVLPQPGTKLVDSWILDRGASLRAKDVPPVTMDEWQKRKATLRQSMFDAMGPPPTEKAPLQPKLLGTLKRDGYTVEKVLFQSWPDVWVTASAYVPDAASDGGKVPAVLVVHGHWSGARRDPVVQSRCLGLVKLGFFVLAVDAFGAGERYINPAKGTYHGALYGSTLWPTGRSLLGMQVYDNNRAVDYILACPECNGKIGITGASGGGNQSMYAGALDERIGAVVPVCSVGNYQAYLKAACCVCEVLPNALRFTEEGDVLGLVAPRALMVINASKDAYQFAPAQADKSIERASHIFKMHGAPDRLKHLVIDSGHDYNQLMREAMYGWMTRFLKEKGTGEPIPEPKFSLDTYEELACFEKAERPATMLFPPSFAAKEAKSMMAVHQKSMPTHPQMWEATAITWRREFAKFAQLGEVPQPVAKTGKPTTEKDVTTVPIVLTGEGGVPIPLRLRSLTKLSGQAPPCILLHMDGKEAALSHAFADGLVRKGWEVIAPDLRGIGETKADRDAIAGAPDHNTAEHSLWIGRPLLGQWLTDILTLLGWIKLQSTRQKELAIVGIGHAGILALMARALPDSPITRVASFGAPGTLITEAAYGTGMPMGLLAPGLFKLGDVPHFAALSTPARVIIADGTTASNARYTQLQFEENFAFTTGVFKACGMADRLRLVMGARAEDLAAL